MKYQSLPLRQMLAAEYVLGTLVGAARRRFQRLLWQDSALRAEVRYWEARFDNLGAFKPVPPRERVWADIEHRLRLQERKLSAVSAPAKASSQIVWKVWSGLATAASLLLALQLWRTPEPAPVAPAGPRVVEVKVQAQAYLAALQLPQEDAQWTVSISPDTRTLRIASSGPAKLDPEKEYELWWLGDEGVTSLGLLPRNGARQGLLPSRLQVKADGKVAVSLEPRGGSPTKTAPTGPVLLATPLVPSI